LPTCSTFGPPTPFRATASTSISRSIALVDRRGYRTTFTLNAAGWQTQIKNPLSQLTTAGYDNAGRPVLRLDARGNRVTGVYDDADRLVGWRYPDGSRVTFGWDAAGRRTLLRDSTGRTSSTFDDADRLTLVVNPAGKRVSYVLDAADQRTLMIEPGGGRFSYSWDNAGRMVQLINPQGQRTSWSFDNAGRVSGVKLANGVRVSNAFDDADQLLRVANLQGGTTTISAFNYAYDKAGNRTRVVEANGDRVTWSFDNLYQLTNERRSGANAYNVTYAWDGAGNRTSMRDGGVPTTYTTNAANQLVTAKTPSGTTTYIFDPSGNQQVVIAPGGGRTTNVWDFENRLVTVIPPTGPRTSMQYDGDGTRVRKDSSAGTSKFIWDEENVLLEADQNDVTQVLYTLQPIGYGNLISQVRAAVTNLYLFDGLGSTSQLTDAFGSVSDSYLYKGFGVILNTTGSTINACRFLGRVGYYFDVELADYLLRARLYDPLLGRFLSQDPLGVLAGINLYAYARSNPIARLDPSGMQDDRRPLDTSKWKMDKQKCADFKERHGCHGLLPKEVLTRKTAPGILGLTYCSNGGIQITIFPPFPGNVRRNDDCFRDCIFQHEEYHRKMLQICCPSICACYPENTFDIGYESKGIEKFWECPAGLRTLLCIQQKIMEIDKQMKHPTCSINALKTLLTRFKKAYEEECNKNMKLAVPIMPPKKFPNCDEVPKKKKPKDKTGNC
jgi:RHS repeat-associated protein